MDGEVVPEVFIRDYTFRESIIVPAPIEKMASRKAINYDEIACTYDKRYEGAYKPDGIASKLMNLAGETRAGRILEVACGTGHWLKILSGTARVYGMDLSFGMLQKAMEKQGAFHLINADIDYLPFSKNSFDMIICVNALHHFRNPSGFILNARKLLKPEAVLVVIGMNPHAAGDRWFIYDYFPGTYQTDLKRYPSPGTILDWMISSGLKNVHWQIGERIVAHRKGNNVFPLSKDFTSQLTLLSPGEYKNGIARIESDLRAAEEKGETVIFPVDISLSMVTGRA